MRLSQLMKNICLKNSSSVIIRYPSKVLCNTLSSTVQATIKNSIKSKLAMPEEKDSISNSIQEEKLKNVHVQHNPDRDTMIISFEYDHDDKVKQFNLNRRATDFLSSSLDRIQLNLAKLYKQKSKTQPPNDQRINVDLLIDGIVVDSRNMKNVDAWVEGAILQLDTKPYQVTRNSPQVEFIDLPSCMMNNFTIMPTVILNNCNIDTCRFAWFRRISTFERKKLNNDAEIEFDGRSHWLKVSSSVSYCPTDEDVAHYLKVICWPSDSVRYGPESSCISRELVEVGPLNCPFQRRHLLTSNKTTKLEQLRVVSYNILADMYADSDYSRTVLFRHCPPHALEIDYRRQLLMKEISGYNGDLIFLQEVDKKEFLRTYEPYLKIVGNYSGLYDTKACQLPEGCATFFRNDKFECINSHRTIISKLIDPLYESDTSTTVDENVTIAAPTEDELSVKLAVQNSKCKFQIKPHLFLDDVESSETKECLARFEGIRAAIDANQNLKKRFMDLRAILQTTLLKVTGLIDTYLIVANTHLYYAPDADHIRLLQGSCCVKYLEHVKALYKKKLMKSNLCEPKISIVFCGDMNSTPDCGLYKLLTEGKVTSNSPDWSSNEEEKVLNLNIQTELKFDSAYKDLQYTNYTMDFNGCLDYIYYETENLICDDTVPLPDHEDVIDIGGIPSNVFPSDHVALIANLKLTKV